jgi:hypothetical protein
MKKIIAFLLIAGLFCVNTAVFSMNKPHLAYVPKKVNDISDDCLGLIFSYLNLGSKVRLVCKGWKRKYDKDSLILNFINDKDIKFSASDLEQIRRNKESTVYVLVLKYPFSKKGYSSNGRALTNAVNKAGSIIDSHFNAITCLCKYFNYDYAFKIGYCFTDYDDDYIWKNINCKSKDTLITRLKKSMKNFYDNLEYLKKMSLIQKIEWEKIQSKYKQILSLGKNTNQIS